MGDQEFDIIKAVDCMTKYSEMVIDPMKRPLVIEEERINFSQKAENSSEEGMLLMAASIEDGDQK